MSLIFNWNNEINELEMGEVCNFLRKGDIVVFPTETVYGIGGDAFNKDACKKIFEAKGRPSDNPLIVHVSDRKMLDKCVRKVNNVERLLIDKFMPGPFTLILPKNDIIPDVVTAGLDSVAIRMPSSEIANRIIDNFGRPIAAPSANKSGKPSGTNILDIKDELDENVAVFIDGGNTEIGLESTVVRVVNEVPIILRPGAVTKEDILDLVGEVKVDEHVLNEVKQEEIVLSPGMKHKHYAPKTKCLLLDIMKVAEKKRIIELFKKKNIAIVGLNSMKKIYEDVDFYGIGDNLNEFSKNIFSKLRELDMFNYDYILIESVNLDGIGLAIMNRLIRTCGYNVLKSSADVKVI